MTKITIDKETFKALASDARLEIIKTLDGRKLNLSEIARKTKLNKATVHEHLTKLLEAELVKKIERDGHKWTYYKLSWKGSNLLHPENTKIVIMFSLAFVFLINGIIQLIWYAKGTLINIGDKLFPCGGTKAAEYGNTTLGNQTISRLASIFENSTLTDNIKLVLNTKSSSGYTVTLGEGNQTAVNGTALGSTSDSINNLVAPQIYAFIQDPFFLYLAIACITIFTILLAFSIWRLWKNRIPAL
ncbi:MAG TPA: ArsR family transcriptional regulator [Thermoplasmatales archaeon]|nr:ArsR family transcriptional regulator [Thermoplasmatales archaeon]